jgi:hypothetical protein
VELRCHFEPDRLGQAAGLVEASVGVAARGAAEVRKGDDGARAPGEFRVAALEAGGQAVCSSSCTASTKLIGLSG